MLLTIDIGNTSINFGLFKKSKLIFKEKIPTKRLSVARVKGLLGKRLRPTDIKGVICCSVVPSATKRIRKIVRDVLEISPLIVDKSIKAPIKNLYKHPKQVGQDRLVNAVAAMQMYGKPVIIIDFGTAITFDFVSKRGDYAGGMIVPGLEISLDTLSNTAALLPKIKLKAPKGLIGKDTITSMQNGVTYGIASLCDGMVHRIRTKYGSRIKVIGTGGNAAFISRFTRSLDRVNPDLTLEGLQLIYTRSGDSANPKASKNIRKNAK